MKSIMSRVQHPRHNPGLPPPIVIVIVVVITIIIANHPPSRGRSESDWGTLDITAMPATCSVTVRHLKSLTVVRRMVAAWEAVTSGEPGRQTSRSPGNRVTCSRAPPPPPLPIFLFLAALILFLATITIIAVFSIDTTICTISVILGIRDITITKVSTQVSLSLSLSLPSLPSVPSVSTLPSSVNTGSRSCFC